MEPHYKNWDVGNHCALQYESKRGDKLGACTHSSRFVVDGNDGSMTWIEKRRKKRNCVQMSHGDRRPSISF
jgi:hypothetical protein